MTHCSRPLSWFVGLVLLLGSAEATAQEKQPLDHNAYSIWNEIHTSELSDDGAWVLYVLGPEKGDDTLRVAGADGTHLVDVPRGGTNAAFSADNRTVVASIRPPEEAEEKDDEEPNDSLAVVDLASGEVTRIADVQSFRLPEEAGSWLAYRKARVDTAEAAEDEEDKKEEEREAGTTLVLRNLETDAEESFERAASYRFTEDGAWLVYAATTPDSTGDGVFAVSTETGEATPVLTGPGDYTRLALDEAGEQVAFLTNRDDVEADTSDYALYRADLGEEAALVARAGTDGVPAGWWVSEHGSVSFSEDGTRLFFGTAPRPAPDTTATLEGEEVEVDIWHWQDPRPQTVQLEEREEELRRTYEAVAHLDGGRVVQLAREDMPNVSVGTEGNADVAVANTNRPYRKRMSWDYPTYYDVYLVDVATGERRLVAEEVQSWASLSLEAQYLSWWDRSERAWYAQSVEPGSTPVNLTEAIPHAVQDERHDRPYAPWSYGSAGWTEGDEQFLLYDKHDIWAVDPTQPGAPRNLTDGAGRDEDLRFRYVDLDPDEEAIDPEAPLLLSAFHYDTKASGFFQDRVEGSDRPTELVMMDRHFSRPEKAEDADRLLVQRESYQEFPDLWTTDLDFADMQQVSRVNPQQENYRWGTAEKVTWTSLAGEPLEGLLFKSEDFNPEEKYPMMVYFYERNADGLHRHRAPEANRSVIIPTFYASRGYVVFVPDIVYEEGYPGQSAYNSIMPGVTALLDQGYIDEERVGVQGHSWGGYQIAYLVTRTDLFAAAEAGAPVVNMTSAYGGIRWGTGRSRMFQYERTQSRIGGSLWEYPMRYLENSPLFELDRVDTPLLIMHNDEDSAVPFEQGLELFLALRRLEKPAWLINYNDEPHWPTEYHLKVDWQMRMQQFFDHYLQDAPAPRWLEEGVPAVEKGRTLGLELIEPATEPADGS